MITNYSQSIAFFCCIFYKGCLQAELCLSMKPFLHELAKYSYMGGGITTHSLPIMNILADTVGDFLIVSSR